MGGLTNFSGGALTGGAYLIGGTLQFNNAAILTNAATIVLDGAAAAIVDESQNDALANLAVNNGSFTIQNGRNFTTGGDFTNNGTLGVGAGSTSTVNGSLTNFSAGTLTGGTYLIGGTFMFNNAAITTNAATIVLDGIGAAAIVDQTGADALAGFAANAVSGSFTIQNGRNFSPAGAFSNAGALIIGAGSTFTASAAFNQTGTLSVLGGGTLNLNGGGTSSGAITNAGTLVVAAGGTFTQSGDLSQNGTLYVQGASILNVSGNLSNAGAVSIDSGSSLTVGGSYAQTDGTTTLTGGTLTAGSLVDIQGGTLAGTGTINGNVQNAGLLTIGDSTTVGTLTINGNYSQTSAGTLALKVGGVASFDRLQLTSGHSATLDGTLQVTLINGYTPTTGDSIQIMTFASETGTFATLTGDGPLFTDIYDATDVKLVAN